LQFRVTSFLDNLEYELIGNKSKQNSAATRKHTMVE